MSILYILISSSANAIYELYKWLSNNRSENVWNLIYDVVVFKHIVDIIVSPTQMNTNALQPPVLPSVCMSSWIRGILAPIQAAIY